MGLDPCGRGSGPGYFGSTKPSLRRSSGSSVPTKKSTTAPATRTDAAAAHGMRDRHAWLQEHVVAGEDVTDVSPDLIAESIGARRPTR